ELAGFGHGNDRVVLTMQHEKRWGIWAQPPSRRRVDIHLLVLGERLLDHELLQERDELLAAVPLGGNPVVAAVDRNGRYHRGVGFLEARLPLWVVWGQRGQRAQVSARRAAGDRDELRVTAVVGDVLLDPGQRALDVDDVVGPGVSGTDAVVDRHAHPAAVGEMAQ